MALSLTAVLPSNQLDGEDIQGPSLPLCAFRLQELAGYGRKRVGVVVEKAGR